MTDMMEKVREFAKNGIAEIEQVQLEELFGAPDKLKAYRIILALVEVAETLREQTYYSCSACEDNLKDASAALTTCDQRIAGVLGDDHHCWADPDNVDHCGHCGKKFGEKQPCHPECKMVDLNVRQHHDDCSVIKEPCANLKCENGKIYLANDAIIEDCLWCIDTDKSTYYHSDPTTKGVEKRTQEEE